MKVPKILILIFLLALFLRLYKLDTFPLGFHVDEAKVAWEAYSILKTGHDDQGLFLPLYYNSFGDFRPTGIFYATIPSLVIFGRSVFATRFPSALFGALTVFPLFYISYLITKNKKLAIFSSLVLAVTPWDITTSRATSEVVISCFLVLTTLALLVKKPTLSFLFLILSFFFYHSARVMGPLLLFVWLIYFWEKLSNKKVVLVGFAVSSILSAILIFSPTGLARYNEVKLTTPTLRDLMLSYTAYFNPNFFVGDIAKPFRYTTANVGIVSIPIFVLFLLGIYIILRTNKSKVLILLFSLGALPAALTLEDSPNLHRAFFMLPFLIIIAAIGLSWLFANHKKIFYFFVCIIIISFINFIVNYSSTSNNFAYEYRNPQVQELASYIAKAKTSYAKIYVTNDPDSPFPWYAFFNNLDPAAINPYFQRQQNGKWQFENIIWDNSRCPAGAAFDLAKKDTSQNKILVVDNGMCATDFKLAHPEAKVIKEFDYPEETSSAYNGIVNYRIWEYTPTRD